MSYPEHEKLAAIADKSQAIGDFLSVMGLTLCRTHQHDKDCTVNGLKMCGRKSGEFEPVRVPLDKLLASFFDINLTVLNAEKDAMLAALRARPTDPPSPDQVNQP